MWEAAASLSVARAFLATASDGQRLYAIGGSDAPGHALACGESYEPGPDAVDDAPSPRPDAGGGSWQPLTASMREARCFPGVALACLASEDTA